MVSKLSDEFRSFFENCSYLRLVLRDAQRCLDDISSAKLFSDGDVGDYSFSTPILQKLDGIINGHPALVVFGQSCLAKANLVNALLDQRILPACSGAWRWVRITYGPTSQVSLIIGSEYELVEKLQSHVEPWTTIPEEDLKRPESENYLLEPSILLEVRICHRLLEGKVQLLIPPDSESFQSSRLQEILQKGLDDLPVFLYSVGSDSLNEQNLNELQVIKKNFPLVPVFFIYLGTNGSAWKLTEFDQYDWLNQDQGPGSNSKTDMKDTRLTAVVNQLVNLGYISLGTQEEILDNGLYGNGKLIVSSEFHYGIDKIENLVAFVRSCLQAELMYATTTLNEILSRLVRKCVLSAFDMAREIQITPRRIQYAQEKEQELYTSLMAIANEKQEEISRLIEQTLEEMKDGLVERAATFRSDGESEEAESTQAIQEETVEIQQLVLSRLSNAVAAQLVNSVDCLQDTFIGTLQRCLESLEKNFHEQDASLLASKAVKQILSAAYNVELSSSSTWLLLHSVVERLRALVRLFRVPCRVPREEWVAEGGDSRAAWRRRVAAQTLLSLSAGRGRLARTVSAQFRDRVSASHTAFLGALTALQNLHTGRLEQTEEQRVAIRKCHAPRLARLALETISMADKLNHGIPRLEKEIGRGQYGVVFSCHSWAGDGPVAVKTVLPPDDKHWNDLAMEFYYSRTIPEHKRVVRLRGSVIDYSYGGERTPAVFLVMDRLPRDLYTGLRSGSLPWIARLQIAIDVVEGIRYLHSQGLMHRDIKLKNVLLDSENRAKLTDLGFCIPEALMSGSIVGTPVHMAPELLSGHYDTSVDVYAFGILFWYICAGHVKLPGIFEKFQNKEQLWISVKRGIRPERLAHFDEQCWALMQQCWSGEPSRRPLLGEVQPLLESIKTFYSTKDTNDSNDTNDTNDSNDIPIPSSSHSPANQLDKPGIPLADLGQRNQ